MEDEISASSSASPIDGAGMRLELLHNSAVSSSSVVECSEEMEIPSRSSMSLSVSTDLSSSSRCSMTISILCTMHQ